jgi:hypothetical protein
MSDGKDLARLMAEYDAAKREHLAAWAAVNGKFAVMRESARCVPPTSKDLQRLWHAQLKRRVIEDLCGALMDAEEDP